MTTDKLRDEITAGFQTAWSINDEAHRASHFEAVFQAGCRINHDLELGFSETMIMLAGYFHDLFAWSRQNHHELSYSWVITTDHPVVVENLTPGETNLVAWACRQHRASFKGDFQNPFAELINSADRGLPGSVGDMLERAIQYRVFHFPELTPEERHAEAVAHLKEKYGTGGYARYPSMYRRCFAAELEKQRARIDAL